jgi:osmoprotectant transport system ATP-binding protein
LSVDFARQFFGRSELGVRLLALGRAGSAARRGEWLEAEPIAAGHNLSAVHQHQLIGES